MKRNMIDFVMFLALKWFLFPTNIGRSNTGNSIKKHIQTASGRCRTLDWCLPSTIQWGEEEKLSSSYKTFASQIQSRIFRLQFSLSILVMEVPNPDRKNLTLHTFNMMDFIDQSRINFVIEEEWIYKLRVVSWSCELSYFCTYKKIKLRVAGWRFLDKTSKARVAN